MMDGGLKQRLAETMHIRWKDAQEAKNFHHTDQHEGDETCGQCLPDLVDWPQLSAPRKQMLTEFIDLLEGALLTMEWCVAPVTSIQHPEELTRTIQPKLAAFIEKFVKMLKHPKGIGDHFPSGELAARIVLNYALREPGSEAKSTTPSASSGSGGSPGPKSLT